MSGVNCIVNSNSTKYMGQLFGHFFHLRLGIFPPQISEPCGATNQRNCEMFSALQSTSVPLTDGVNRAQSIPSPLTADENNVQIDV